MDRTGWSPWIVLSGRLASYSARGSGADAWAHEMARLTQACFAVPGHAPATLPAPGGAEESPENVLKDLARGGRVWVARLPSGHAIGTVRAVPAGDGTWELKRLGVVPAYRGNGVARRLVRRVEAEARRSGVGRVILYCVVERLLPPYYARLGYRIVERRPHTGKPLTVVTMERNLASPGRPLRSVWDAEDALPPGGIYVVWLWLPQPARVPVAGPQGLMLLPGLYAYVGSAQRQLPARLDRHVRGRGRVRWHIDHLRRQAQVVGVDVLAGAPRSDECGLAGRLTTYARAPNSSSPEVGSGDNGPADPELRPPGFGAGDCRCPGHLVYFGASPATVEAFAMPRRLLPDLLAVFRLPAA